MYMDKEFIKNRVYSIRSSHNISARSLSLELGMSSEYVNQLEMGRMNPSLEFLINFCDYFHLTLSEFFDEGNNYPVEVKNILSILNHFSKEQVEKLIAFLDSIK